MRFFFSVVVVFVSFNSYLFAQQPVSTKSNKAAMLYQDAYARANRGIFDQAIISLEQAVKEDPNFVDAWCMLGELYSDTHADSLAILSFKKAYAINPDFFPYGYYELADLERKSAKYDDALTHIRKYFTFPNTNSLKRNDAELLLKSCEFAVKAIKNPVSFNPVNVGSSINDKYDQYWPCLSADEQTMVITEALPRNPDKPATNMNRNEDLYFSVLNNDEWSTAKPVGAPLNTFQNEGAQTISGDGKIMIFTGCDRQEGYGKCDLYFSKKEGNHWSEPQNMGRPINSPAMETQPSLSSDGKTLYFASNRPGGKGGLDIWMSSVNDEGYWNNPVNLGDSVNTSYDDQSPFIHPDNKTLYFSSKGWPGMGGFDIFLSRRKGDNDWTTARNLGYPINTNAEEMGIVVSARGTTAYYSSNRLGGFGGNDIYSFELYKEARPTRVSYMKGNVFDAETSAPLTARFELIDLVTGKDIMDAVSNNDGSFLICLPEGNDYALNVNRKGYLFYSDNFTMSHGDLSKPYLKDIPLKPIKAGEKVVMRNIFFDSDSYQLKPESKVELGRLIKFLKENPAVQIEISGHTDNSGTTEYNRKLSENRARSVADYLVQNGADAKMITSKGYGESQPVASNNTDEGKAQNRRTEFKVLKTK